MAVKNITSWIPPSGEGYVTNPGNENIVTNSGFYLVDNLGNNIVTTPLQVTPKNIDTWTLSSRNDTSWIGKTVVEATASNIADPSGNLLVDPSGNYVVDTGSTYYGKFDTSWTKSSKFDTGWIGKTLVTATVNNIADPSANLLVDPSGNYIVDTGTTESGKSITTWEQSGV